MAVAHMSSHSSMSPATAPARRSPSRLPRLRNVMLITNPGPVKSQSFHHEKGGAAPEDEEE
jgi:hypothetical protein